MCNNPLRNGEVDAMRQSYGKSFKLHDSLTMSVFYSNSFLTSLPFYTFFSLFSLSNFLKRFPWKSNAHEYCFYIVILTYISDMLYRVGNTTVILEETKHISSVFQL